VIDDGDDDDGGVNDDGYIIAFYTLKFAP